MATGRSTARTTGVYAGPTSVERVTAVSAVRSRGVGHSRRRSNTLSKGTLHRNLAASLAADLSPDAIIGRVENALGPNWVIASSFQLTSLVIIDVARKVLDRPPSVAFLDTGFHFQETIEFRDRLVADWGLDLVNIGGPGAQGTQAEDYGEGLYRRDPELCCRINKVDPLWRTLAGYQGWMSGLRRSGPSRQDVPVIQEQRLPSGDIITKVNPLATWSWEEVDAYVNRHGLPRHPLLQAGYTSIGCAPCTAPSNGAPDDRSGRWPGLDKTECGIHV